MKEIDCNVCGSRKNTKVFSVRDLYIKKDNPAQFTLVHCGRCGFAYLNPQPNYEELSPFYQNGYFDSVKKSGDRKGLYLFLKKIRRKIFPKFHPRFYRWDIGDRKLPANFLDVGCATGAKAQTFIDDFPKWKFFGVEPDAQAAKIAATVPGLTVSHGFLKGTHYPDNFFDVVLFHHVLEHTLDPRGDIEENHRILKPGGRLIVVVPNYASFAAKFFGKYWRHLDIPRHLFHFRKQDLKNLLDDVGFDIKEMGSESIQGSLLNSFLISIGIEKTFDNTLPIVLFRFFLIPINKVAEIFGLGGALCLLATKRK